MSFSIVDFTPELLTENNNMLLLNWRMRQSSFGTKCWQFLTRSSHKRFRIWLRLNDEKYEFITLVFLIINALSEQSSPFSSFCWQSQIQGQKLQRFISIYCWLWSHERVSLNTQTYSEYQEFRQFIYREAVKQSIGVSEKTWHPNLSNSNFDSRDRAFYEDLWRTKGAPK